jgi:hypothetical protein
MPCDFLIGHPTGRDDGSTGEPSIWLPLKLEVLKITALRPYEKRIEEKFRRWATILSREKVCADLTCDIGY